MKAAALGLAAILLVSCGETRTHAPSLHTDTDYEPEIAPSEYLPDDEDAELYVDGVLDDDDWELDEDDETDADSDFRLDALHVKRLAPDLALLSGPGGNMLVAHDATGALIVDTMDASTADALQELLATLGAGPQRVVVDTHWHSDHTDGNVGLAEHGARIVAHENVRARRAVEQQVPALGIVVPALPAHALPRLTYAEGGLELHGPAGLVRVLHAPAAHTDSDSLVHFVERDLLHTGDLFEGDDYPFLDVHSGGSLDGLIAGLEQALSLCGAETVVIPGHGAPSTRVELQRTLDMLRRARKLLAALVDEGLALEAILEADPLADDPEHWGDGFISRRAFTYTAAQSLLQARAAKASTGER